MAMRTLADRCTLRAVAEECGVQLRNIRYQQTLNVVRPADNYHYVVIIMVGAYWSRPGV